MKRFLSGVFFLAVCSALIVLVYDTFYNPGFIKGLIGEYLSTESKVEDVVSQVNSSVKNTPTPNEGLKFEKFDLSNLLNPEKFKEVSHSVPKPSPYYTLHVQKGGYESLKTKNSQQLYKSLVENSYWISDKKEEYNSYRMKQSLLKKVQLSEKEIRVAISAFKEDNPELFWITNSYSYAYQYGNTIVQLYSYVNSAECSSMIAKLNTKVQAVVKGVGPKLSEFDREFFLHKKIVDTCKYDYAAVKDSSLWKSYTAYGAIVEGRAVCEGYSRAIQMLLSYAGISCNLVNGFGEDSLHMWNMVKIDGNWYHLDSTWNDTDSMQIYDYFNVTDKVILADHKISPLYTTLTDEQIAKEASDNNIGYNLNLPACMSEKANFYKVKAVPVLFTAQSDQQIVNKLKELAAKKEKYLYLTVGTGLNFKSTVNKMFQTSPYKFFDYVEKANSGLKKASKIDYESVQYIESEDKRSITVELSY